MDIVNRTIELRQLENRSSDIKLIKRRECEYELFLSIEEAYELPAISAGFTSISDFVGHAQTILQRRKARSGRSLELQTKAIFLEEGLIEGVSFQHGVDAEPGRKPDFIFPSQAAYRDPDYPPASLRMLAAKTTCKDRWRQILQEAVRIEVKHLLTLQQGISERQFAEMEASHVQLVVPQPLISYYPESVQPRIMTLESFISEVRHLNIVE